MVDVVLLHGTTQGASGWRLVESELQERGLRTLAPDLPDDGGLGVDAYADAVRAATPSVRAAVVVAHSGAGVLLPRVAAELQADWAVWLCAYVPTPAASLLDETSADPAALFHEDWVGQDPVADHGAARRLLFHDCDPRRQAWALTTLRRFFPIVAFRERGNDPLACGARAVVVVAEEDRTLRSEWLTAASKERLDVEPLRVGAGHCPHVSVPARIAEIITSL